MELLRWTNEYETNTILAIEVEIDLIHIGGTTEVGNREFTYVIRSSSVAIHLPLGRTGLRL